MEVYLIRHGIAAERGTYTHDEERPLTDKGRKRTINVAQRLLSIGLKLDLVLTSPLIRASQTASILQEVGLTEEVQEFIPLKPGGDINLWLQWLEQWHRNHLSSKLALVGHQPDLSSWGEMLIWGTIKEQLVLKKAGVIGVQIPDIGTPVCRSKLFLLTSPKWLL